MRKEREDAADGDTQGTGSPGGAGVEVSLYWSPATGSLTVVVDDARAEERFELEARADNALEVFYHPYAYAPLRAGTQASPSAALAGDCSQRPSGANLFTGGPLTRLAGRRIPFIPLRRAFTGL